jgi:protein-disulfide isomerase
VKSVAPILCMLLLAACSRHEERAPATAVPAESPAAPAASALSPVPVSAELQAHLVRAASPVLGPASASVTIVEFLDPACEACRAFAPVVKQIQFLYPDDVRVVMRFAAFHPGSEEAIRILMAAQRQKRFEPVLAALFEHQEEWAAHGAPNIDAAWAIAGGAGLDVQMARKYAAMSEVNDRLRQEDADLTALQVERTPTFYVNGKLLQDFGARQLMDLVKSELPAAAPGSAR